MYSIMSSENSEILASSFPISFLFTSFSSVIAIARTSNILSIEDEMVGCITNLIDMSLSKLWEVVMDGGGGWQRRPWQPTPVLLPGKSHGRRSLVAAIHGVAKSRTQLGDFTFTFNFHALEKEMVTHSSVLAWRIPGTGEPGGLPSMGSHRIGHN